MKSIEIDTDWLQMRAEQEYANILSKKINCLQYLFTSDKKIRENEDEAIKSLAKTELILEIFQEYNKKMKENE